MALSLSPSELADGSHAVRIQCPGCGRSVEYESQFVVGHTTSRETGSAKRVEVPLSEPRADPCYLGDFGCGAGALIYPLLEKNGGVFAAGFDFAASAVLSARDRPRFTPERMRFNQLDITAPLDDGSRQRLLDLSGVPSGRRFDYCTLVFVLSALEPSSCVQALRNIRSLTSERGMLCVYDYADDDHRRQGFAERHAAAQEEWQKLSDSIRHREENGDAEEDLGKARFQLRRLAEKVEETAPLFGRADVFSRGEGTVAAFYPRAELERWAVEAGWRVVESIGRFCQVLNHKSGTQFRRSFSILKLRSNGAME